MRKRSISGDSKSKGKPRGLRRDRDCFTCKERNVKCDLNRPACTPCIEAGLVCQGYPSRIIWSNMTTTSSAPNPSASATTSSANSPNPLSVTGPSAIAPSASSVSSSAATSTVAAAAAIQTGAQSQQSRRRSAGGRRGGSRRTRSSSSYSGSSSPSLPTSASTPGYLPPPPPPRQQQLSFYTYPYPIERSSRKDDGEETVNVDIARQIENMFSYDINSPVSRPLSYIMDTVDPLQPSNFIWGVKAILTAFNHAREFNIEVKHEDTATSSAAATPTGSKERNEKKTQVLSTIWKFVSSFLNSSSNTADPGYNFEYRSLQLKAAAIEELKQFINDGIIEAVFAILAFTYFDVCQGTFGGWDRHLMGARSLLDIHCPDAVQLYRKEVENPGLRHALTLLNWYDVMGAVAAGNRPLIFEDWHREIMEPPFFTLVGCPRETFFVFAEAAKKNTLSETDRLSGPLWKSLSEVLKIPIKRDISYENHASNCWQYASLLFSISPPGHASTNPELNQTIQTLVVNICTSLSCIPQDSAFSQHLAICVYLAGLHARNVIHREMIARYWTYWRSVKFPLYPDALEKCQEQWRRHNAT
ncbi:hypothetical protein TRVA0_002S00782 [Trichomonascus vanleenenianus]|uniref:Zn(II)2Cys6 transcription factor n=1 Tax=Trichomonascus vanleenenianus TaxID=2268995 RepID=UPI003ECB31DE